VEGNDGLELYYPYTQWPTGLFTFAIRLQGDPISLIDAARKAVWAVDKNTSVVRIETMEQIISESLWQRRLWGVLLAVFAGMAMLLAAVGIYGVMSYLVGRRSREIGVKMALGATSKDIFISVVGEGMKLTMMGIILGLATAFALGRLMTGLLFGITAYDPATFTAAPFILMAIAFLACWLPARRATKVNPLTAIRDE
jgi:putative ABC transport system permease protein